MISLLNRRRAPGSRPNSIFSAAALLLALTASTPARCDAAPDNRVWPIPDWPVATPESQGVDSAKLNRLRDYLAERQSRAALLIRHGRIIGEWYWRGTTAETKLPVFSVTKSITGTAVGMLIGDRKLALDQSASDSIPAWKSDNRKAITIRHLVTMTSGLKLEDIAYFFKQNQFDLALKQPLAVEPGTKWEYNNLACNCLSAIVTAASGTELGDFVEGRLFKPLGMKNSTMDRLAGHTTGYMGLRTTARDLARFGYLYLNKGAWNGTRILSEDWVREATSTSQKLYAAYGYLWWVHTGHGDVDDPADSYEAIGLYGNYLCVFPSQDMILVRLIGGGSGEQTSVDRARMKRLALESLSSSR